MAATRRDARVVEVLVVGDVLTDVLVRPAGPRSAGSDTPARIEQQRGGQGANQAAWLAAEGVRVGLAARVAAGDRDALASELAVHGIVPLLAGDDRRLTGTIVVLVDPVTGERDMFSDRGAALALSPADLEPGLAATHRWVHLSGYALFGDHGPEVAATATNAGRRRGLGVSIDPASTSDLRRFGIERFLGLVAGIDVLLPNADEALLLTGTGSPRAAAMALLDVAQTVAVTRGAAGAVVARRGGELIEAPARTTTVVDTTGAGDAFTAGFLAAYISGAAAAACLERGLHAAERAVACVGAQPPRFSSSPMLPGPGGRRHEPRPAG